MARDGEIIQRQHFCHYGDTICQTMSGYVTTKLQGTSTADATIMRYFREGYIYVYYRCQMPPMLIWHWQSIGRSCQSSEMATLLQWCSVELIIFRV